MSLTLCFRRVCGHAVEYVHQDEEECDEERHPAGDHVGGNHEADPGDNHEQTWKF